MRVGYIGLGNIGKPMARNVLRAGFDLGVYNRSQHAVEELEREGATRHDSVASLAATSDVVLVCLPDGPTTLEVVTGPGGVLSSAASGTLVCDHGTSGPDATRILDTTARDAGMEFIEAPVTGGPSGAASGTLTLLVGGTRTALDRVRPVLSATSRDIFHCGPVGTGNTAKLVCNYIAMINLVGALEGMTIGVKAGIDAGLLYRILVKSTARSFAIEKFIPENVLPGDFSPTSRLRNIVKDVGMARTIARAGSVRTLLGAVVDELMVEGVGRGFIDQHTSVLVRLFEDQADVSLRSDPRMES
jgi:3-hydroxyisobutyrate dehydrogenase